MQEQQQLIGKKAWAPNKKPMDAYGNLATDVIYGSFHALKKALKRNDTDKAEKELAFLRTESPWHRYLDIDMGWIEKTITRMTETYSVPSAQHISPN